MKYYRYAKCMGGGKHPHPDLLIGESGRVHIRKAEIVVGRKLTRYIDDICRYHTRSG